VRRAGPAVDEAWMDRSNSSPGRRNSWITALAVPRRAGYGSSRPKGQSDRSSGDAGACIGGAEPDQQFLRAFRFLRRRLRPTARGDLPPAICPRRSAPGARPASLESPSSGRGLGPRRWELPGFHTRRPASEGAGQAPAGRLRRQIGSFTNPGGTRSEMIVAARFKPRTSCSAEQGWGSRRRAAIRRSVIAPRPFVGDPVSARCGRLRHPDS
jgi:hypothetical protein